MITIHGLTKDKALTVLMRFYLAFPKFSTLELVKGKDDATWSVVYKEE